MKKIIVCLLICCSLFNLCACSKPICSSCNGTGSIDCIKCSNGVSSSRCYNCNKGYFDCEKCSGKKYVRVKTDCEECAKSDRPGYVIDSAKVLTDIYKGTYKEGTDRYWIFCGSCNEKCSGCNASGRGVKCSVCNENGYLFCKQCNGKGIVSCSAC